MQKVAYDGTVYSEIAVRDVLRGDESAVYCSCVFDARVQLPARRAGAGGIRKRGVGVLLAVFCVLWWRWVDVQADLFVGLLCNDISV